MAFSEYKSIRCLPFFGNLPPLFPIKGSIILYLHNRLLLNAGQSPGNALQRIKLFIERAWLRSLVSRVGLIGVQTMAMAIMTKNMLKNKNNKDSEGRKKVVIAPFAKEGLLTGSSARAQKRAQIYDFCYPASGERHKNHKTLVDAWVVLAKQGHRPSLALTLNEDAFPKLCREIESSVKKYQLKIYNLGDIPASEMQNFYRSSAALVFPSITESFGLPLLEANHLGLSILAPELDYVRDSVDPIESFDPTSPVSISRAILRFLQIQERRRPILTPKSALKKLGV